MRTVTPDELGRLVDDYRRDGFAYVRSMFTADDLAPLAGGLVDGAAPGSFAVTDSQGGKQELSVWLHLGDDLIGVIPRLAPVVSLAEAAVDDRVHEVSEVGRRTDLDFVDLTKHEVLDPGPY